LAAFTSTDFLGALEKSECHAPFSGEDSFRTVETAANGFAMRCRSKPALFGLNSPPFRALLKKGDEKHGENREKRAEKCRKMSVFRGPKATFRRARGRRRENVNR
jgi:hypothetical protein